MVSSDAGLDEDAENAIRTESWVNPADAGHADRYLKDFLGAHPEAVKLSKARQDFKISDGSSASNWYNADNPGEDLAPLVLAYQDFVTSQMNMEAKAHGEYVKYTNEKHGREGTIFAGDDEWQPPTGALGDLGDTAQADMITGLLGRGYESVMRAK